MRGERLALAVVSRLAGLWDDARYHAKIRLGLTSPPILLPYRGHIAHGRLHFGGRVVEDEGIVGAEPTLSRWENLKRTFRRYETDEIREAEVAWQACGRSGTAVTDEQGFFEIEVEAGAGPAQAERPWEEVRLTLLKAKGYAPFEPRRETTWLRSVSPRADYVIVSDIDDTIIETGARNLLRHWRTVALNSAEGRVAFPGIAWFYRALCAGRDGGETNPIFYVSSSPWNLYDLIDDFLTLREIPHGPMMLKDFGLDAKKWLTGNHADHKLASVAHLMDSYPDLPFLLIGDTGQSDAAIYAELVARHGRRILAVFLRDVTPEGLMPGVREAVARIEAAGVPVTTGPTLESASRLAEELGLVEPGTSERMAREIVSDGEKLKDWKWPRPFGLHSPERKAETKIGG